MNLKDEAQKELQRELAEIQRENARADLEDRTRSRFGFGLAFCCVVTVSFANGLPDEPGPDYLRVYLYVIAFIEAFWAARQMDLSTLRGRRAMWDREPQIGAWAQLKRVIRGWPR